MKNLMTILLATAMLGLGTQILAADTYGLDRSHSNVGFEVSHMVISDVEGEFSDYDIHLSFDQKNVEKSSVHAVIRTTSVDTDNDDRDKHLRTPEFFNVEQYPTMEFMSKRIEKRGKEWVAVGDFTLLGVTKQIELPFEVKGPITDPWGNVRIGVEAETTIDRKDYGMEFSKAMDTGGLVVGNEVEIKITFEAIKQ